MTDAPKEDAVTRRRRLRFESEALARCIKELKAAIASRVYPEGPDLGRPQAEARAYLEGHAYVLVNLLRGRFGAISEAHEKRIRSASIEELGVWLDRVLTSRSIDELLA